MYLWKLWATSLMQCSTEYKLPCVGFDKVTVSYLAKFVWIEILLCLAPDEDSFLQQFITTTLLPGPRYMAKHEFLP